MIQIERERWIIVCSCYQYSKSEGIKIEPIERQQLKVFCGLARNFKLKAINEIENTAIKTYLSKSKAESAFISSWWNGEELIRKGIAKAVKVTEIIKEAQ